MSDGMHVISVHAEFDRKTDRKWWGWNCSCGADSGGWWIRKPTPDEVEEDALEHVRKA